METDTRYISIKESLEGACKEVSLMLQGKLKETTWDEAMEKLRKKYGNEVVIP